MNKECKNGHNGAKKQTGFNQDFKFFAYFFKQNKQ